MALEPITRQEKIIAGQDLTPITRMEKFLKDFGGGSGGSIPKPITYDYMPEGYPKKSVGTVTLMEEQEVTFTKEGNAFGAVSPVNLELADGEKLTVVWDGVSYNTVVTVLQGQFPAFGNLGLAGLGDVTDYPFLYFNQGVGIYLWVAEDTATSHTISVTTAVEVITPMAREFLPSVVNELVMNSSTPDSTKKFKITVNDSGTISATEVT